MTDPLQHTKTTHAQHVCSAGVGVGCKYLGTDWKKRISNKHTKEAGGGGGGRGEAKWGGDTEVERCENSLQKINLKNVIPFCIIIHSQKLNSTANTEVMSIVLQLN